METPTDTQRTAIERAKEALEIRVNLVEKTMDRVPSTRSVFAESIRQDKAALAEIETFLNQ